MPQTTIRAARAEDRAAVLAFCTDTWEWGDYIERVWDEWLGDAEGVLLVATVEEQPVGLLHVRMVTKTDAWLEGMRVDPAFRRQGLAGALHEAALLEAMRRHATYVRLATEVGNTPAIQLCKRMHMRQVGAFVPFNGTPIVGVSKRQYGMDRTELATLADLDEMIDYLNVSNIFPMVGGLYYCGFVAYVITDELLREKIAAQQVYLLRRWQRLDGLAIAESDEGRQGMRLSVGYIDGTTIESVSLIAYDLRRRLPELELERVYAYAPDLMLVRDAFAGVEYEWRGNVFYTFERGLT